VLLTKELGKEVLEIGTVLFADDRDCGGGLIVDELGEAEPVLFPEGVVWMMIVVRMMVTKVVEACEIVVVKLEILAEPS
jgi:hypothetical protein